uniref:Transposon TX1 uncharacterized n=1 Tax=Cajanus cajan TaxID=3821 RepID=A0A151S1J4_CAJCA|nr:Transposon TX1 uncharacterized [Cajanus cajan]
MGYSPLSIQEARGLSGGIWALGKDNSDIHGRVVESHPQAITIQLSSNGLTWCCTRVYGHPVPRVRDNLWVHLQALRNNISVPWLLLGDFNDILAPSEQRGGSFSVARASVFAQYMDNCGLMNIPLLGRKYTWHRMHQGFASLHKQLDRALSDVHWTRAFPEAVVEVLPRAHSDHHPLILRSSGGHMVTQKRPFRFEAAWCSHQGYEAVVWNAWKQSSGNILESLSLIRKCLGTRLGGLERYLEKVDSRRHALLYQELFQQYELVLQQEETLWYQKSREKWIKLGNKNTAFFHTQIVVRRKRNRILGLHLPSGAWCTDGNLLKQEALAYFKSLLGASEAMPQVLPPCPISLSMEEQASLETPVSKAEVFDALRGMKSFKAPGPDGFQPIFYKQYWHMIGDDVWRFVASAFENGRIDAHATETLLVLIPKGDHPRTFKDFRPISLCNVVYKLVSKVLVNRLRPFLMRIVSPFQSSFIPGKGTMDNAIIFQEIIHTLSKSKKKKGVTLAKLSLLWNGECLESFSPKRGLRQGDPLSPYLFVLCMERLGHIIQEQVSAGVWAPLKLGSDGPPLSHLFFVHDVLLFSKATPSHIRMVTESLQRFCNASGLKVNLTKSRMMASKGVPRSRKNSLTQITNIIFTNDLGKYLGFQMLRGRVTTRHFGEVMTKVQGRLAAWKGRLLSRLDALSRRFIWSGEGARKLHLVKWETLTRPRKEGGLGVCIARNKNISLLGKLIWDLFHHTDKLWVRVVMAKYRDRNVASLLQRPGSYVLTSLRRAFEELRPGFRFQLGDGEASFWFETLFFFFFCQYFTKKKS